MKVSKKARKSFLGCIIISCLDFKWSIVFNPPKPGPQSRALCGAVCALLIAMVLY